MHLSETITRWLEEQIAKLGPGMLLPSDAELARQWNVSERTVRRIMHQLRERGVVMRVPGKGTFIPGAEQVSKSLAAGPSKMSSVQKLAKLLTDSIATGDLRRGQPLPLVKSLSLQYHLSQKTIIEAYRLLQGQGLVSKMGKRYWVGGFSARVTPPREKEVYLFVTDAGELPRIYADSFLSTAYQEMERELRHCGMILHYRTVDELSPMLSYWRRNDRYPAGLIFCRVPDYESVAGRIAQLKPMLRRRIGAHPSVLLEAFQLGGIRPVPSAINMVAHGNLTTTQARSIGEYARRMNGRKIALVLDGQRIRQNPRKGFLRYLKFLSELLVQSPKERDIHLAVYAGEARVSKEWVLTHGLGADPDYLVYLKEKYKLDSPPSRASFGNNLCIFDDFRQLHQRLHGDSLLVCTHDSLAMIALDQLSKAAIRIPQQVSLLTLENDPRNYHREITSCAPDWHQIGYLMAHAITADIPLKRTHRGLLRIACPVIERQTTQRSV